MVYFLAKILTKKWRWETVIMKTLHPFISLWINPRATIQKLTVSYSPSNDVRLILLLSLAYFIQISLFILMVDVIPGSVLISMKGLQAIIWGILVLGIGSYTYASLTSFMMWNIAKWFKGEGSLVNTRTALVCSMFTYLPVGFSILLVYFAYSQKLIGKPIFLLDIISLIGLPLVFIYSFILMLKMIAEINHFSLWWAFISILLCGLLQAGIIFSLFMILRN